MEQKIAAVLIASLVERIDRDRTIGTVSSHEREALGAVLSMLGGYEVTDLTLASSAAQLKPEVDKAQPVSATPDRAGKSPALPSVELDLTSIERDSPTDPDVILCLDFGTAMSKAFASATPGDEHLELELGTAAGGKGFSIPSSVFIADDGMTFFGKEAIDISQDLLESGRERLDSIKGWLSLRREGNLDGDACLLQASLNPTAFRVTQGDLIRIYLAYLTDLAGIALDQYELQDKRVERYARRRYARPCWPDVVQAQWADAQMRSMMAEAQILADTFSGRWSGGINIGELKAAVEKVKALGKRPDYLIESSVPEPVAVAAGAVADTEVQRWPFMVVDVGAGTTDFGLFVQTQLASDGLPKVFQVPESIRGLMQAGDKVDGMLRTFIARRESVDGSDSAGRMILADLSRRIRSLKEALFLAGVIDYVLVDGTIGRVALEDFLSDELVKRFTASVEDGFKKALEAVDDSYIRWIAGTGLRVVLTGGSSQLPMMKALAEGTVQIRDFTIERVSLSPQPEWMQDAAPELLAVYPQLAVAIGGSAQFMPETLNGPPLFGGGKSRHGYVASRLQISGSH